ncbi:MAG TPA: imidazolonepropionase [Candidatus Cloacimonadota bacterium]|nr:imidazolonepropionase [Candidatus Cloacimonadota bacterium]
MKKVDLLIVNAKELVTLQGPNRARKGREMKELGVIPQGTIAVQDGKIVAIGKTAEITEEYKSKHIVEATGKVVMPGFVDPHTHPIFVHTRENEYAMRIEGKTYVEIAQAGGGIRSTIKTTRDASKTVLFDLALNRIRKMMNMGTTTLEAKSGYGLSTESEIRQLEVIHMLQKVLPLDIVPTFMGAHEYPAEYKENHEEYLRILENEMLPAVKDTGLAEYCDIFTEAHVYSIDESRRILTRAKELGFKLRMHADELEPIGGAELAAELGCITADHLGAASDKGIKALAEKNVIAVLLSGTIFSLGLKSYARARDMITAGVPVALATDYNPGSCNCDSMQTIISIACSQMRMTPEEAITASTINSAYALELGDRVGSFEVGKQADLLIMDIPSYKYIPYHLGSSGIETVIKKGEIIYNNMNS